MTAQPLSSSDLTALAERTREATEGPWTVQLSWVRRTLCVVSDDTWICGELENPNSPIGDEADANAALIAAAPALLATALKQQEENEKLRELLTECANDLESEIEGHYRDIKDHPAIAPKYELDMDTVRRARAALSPKTGASG